MSQVGVVWGSTQVSALSALLYGTFLNYLEPYTGCHVFFSSHGFNALVSSVLYKACSARHAL